MGKDNTFWSLVTLPDRLFVLAETACNHMGDVGLLWQMIQAAHVAGADAVTVQVLDRQAFSTAPPQGPEIEIAPEGWTALFQRAGEEGILIIPCVLDPVSARRCLDWNVSAVKVHGTDILALDYLAKVGAYGLPVILETQAAYLDEVESAVRTLRVAGCERIVICHGYSNYPTPMEELNLCAAVSLGKLFDLPCGVADHTLDVLGVPTMVQALGINLLEKHITLDRSAKGYDWQVSLEQAEFAEMVSGLRERQVALGNGRKRPSEMEASRRSVLYKKIVASRPLSAGEVLTRESIVLKRSAGGLLPSALPRLLGRELAHPVNGNEPLVWRHFDPNQKE